MVAFVSGNSLGLELTSGRTLGANGMFGSATLGRSNQNVFVNLATGNLVLQGLDGGLASQGVDPALLRIYNSRGLMNDDNGDNWSLGVYAQQLLVNGAPNSAGSTVVRTDRDGAQATYQWDSQRQAYTTTAGAGAHDTIVYDSAAGEFRWQQDGSGLQESYAASSGRLVRSVDPAGSAITYAYDEASGRLLGAQDASGERVWYDYDGNRLKQIRTEYKDDAGQFVTRIAVRYEYDASNRLSAVVADLTPDDNSVADGKVFRTEYTYDGTSKRVQTVRQSDGVELTFSYVNTFGGFRVATITDGMGAVTSFQYGSASRTVVTDARNNNWTYDYDAAGQLVKAQAPDGQSTTYVYDADGNVKQVTDAQGRALDMDYDARGNQVLQRDAAGNTVTRRYDIGNRLVSESTYLVADPDGAGALLPATPVTTRHVYAAVRPEQLRFTVAANGSVTEYTYNGYGERTSVRRYAGAVYPVAALAVDADLSESSLVGWASAQDKSRSSLELTSYNARGLLESVTTYAEVDAAGTGVATTAQTTSFVYDPQGRLLQRIEPASPAPRRTQFTYDGLGRPLTTVDALGNVVSTLYDDAGNRVTQTTSNNTVVVAHTFDKAGRLVSTQRSSSTGTALGTTRFAYDKAGNLLMTTDATGARNWSLYTAAGLKQADIDATGAMTEYVYDSAGRMTRTVRYVSGVNTASLVDATGQPTGIAISDAALGRTANSAKDLVSWNVYDAAGRIVKTVDGAGGVVGFEYDGAGRLVRSTAYAGRIATAGLGAAPSPESITPDAADPANRTSRRFYDAAGLLIGELDGEGFLSSRTYDGAGRLVMTRRYATPTPENLRAGGTFAQLLPAATAQDRRELTYYNDRGEVVATIDAENYLTEYGHDSGRLAEVKRYANRLTASANTNSDPATLRPAASAEDRRTLYAYDALGRKVRETGFDGVVTRHSYDARGFLTETTRAQGTAAEATTARRYDSLGRAVAELSAAGRALITVSSTPAEIETIWAQYGIDHEYDLVGRRISSTDAMGRKTLYFYGAANRLAYSVNPLGEVQQSEYNALGQLAAETRYATRISVSGLTGGAIVDALTTRIAAITNAAIDSNTTYTYNLIGRVEKVTTATQASTTTTYNAFAEVVEQRTTVDGVSDALRSDLKTYDRRGQLLTSTADRWGANITTSQVVDAFGQVISAVDGRGVGIEQSYDRLGRLITRKDALAKTRSTTFDAFDRVLTQTDENQNTTTYAYNAAQRTLTVRTAENLAVVTRYDELGQVYQITDPNQVTKEFRYDRDGRLTETWVGGTRISQQTYDAAGLLSETVDASGIKVRFTYDAANRVLTRTHDPKDIAANPNGLDLKTSYAYDGKGQQVSVTDARGTRTDHTYDRDGRKLTETVDPTGLALRTTYAYDLDGQVLSVTSPNGTTTR